MAMNKKEQAEMDALREELRIARAFRFTDPVERDVMPPESCYRGEGLTTGYDFNEHIGADPRSYSSAISHQWSGSVSHGDMPYSEYSGSQGSRRLFSTKLLALRALRFALERRFAKRLAAVDAAIEKELADAEAATP